LFPNVLLQAGYLLSGNFDSTSESEIIAFKGVIRSGAGSIIHAGGAGGFCPVTFDVELQPALASSNIIVQLVNSCLSIG
jgi:hypothetical protein